MLRNVAEEFINLLNKNDLSRGLEVCAIFFFWQVKAANNNLFAAFRASGSGFANCAQQIAAPIYRGVESWGKCY